MRGDATFDASEVRRAKYTIYVNAACCFGWVVITILAAWRLGNPRLLGLSAAAFAMVLCWILAVRDLRSGRVIRGVLTYVTSGLLLLLTMGLFVPEMSVLFMFATFIFLAFGLSYADTAASSAIVALTMLVAGALLFTSLVLRLTSGVDPNLVRWVNVTRMTMALAINATSFIALRKTLQARGERIHDITERLEAERALHESEERYRLVFEQNPLPMWVFDLETLRFLAVNDAAVRAYGYSRDEFLAMTIRDIRLPEDVPAVLAAVAQTAAGHAPRGGPWRHRRKDGTEIEVEITAHPLPYAGRTAEIVIARDITQTHRAEEALRRSEERLRLLVDNARDYAIFMLDPAGYVASWNRGAERIKGYTAEEIVGRHFACFYPPDAVAAGKPEAALQAAAETGRHEEEHWLVRKDGSWFWADAVITAVRDEGGALVGFAKVTRDLSARRRAEEALRASEEQFRILAVTATDAIVSADHQGHITYLNPSAERMFGYAARDVRGEPLTVLMPERFHEAHRAGLARYLATEEPHVVGKTVDLVGRRKDGTEFPLELSLASWKRGSAYAFTGIIRDVTERRHAEDALRRYAAQLEAANAELDAFAYSVSHDLRAPLRSIDGFSHALVEDCASRLDEQGKGYLERVRSATQRMAQLIDDLLALSRVTRSEMRATRMDLSTLAESVAAELGRTEPSRQVEFAIAARLVVHADPGLMRVVLENLLGNAWKFTRKQPRARIEVGVTRHDDAPAYFVRDNGAGFDMSYVDKLFSAFQRLHGTSEFEGTGIGLATVQRIIRRHGGRVWAEGAVGRGATIFFTL